MKAEDLEQAIRRAVDHIRQRTLDGKNVVVATIQEAFYVVVLPLGCEPPPVDPGLDRAWKKDFLKWLRKGRSVKVAAELSGVTPRHAHRTYHRDLVFRKTWNEIKTRSGEEVKEVEVIDPSSVEVIDPPVEVIDPSPEE